MSQYIINWNIDGYFSHINELNLLIDTYDPYIINFNETKFKFAFVPSHNKYDFYFINKLAINNVASGGVATAVNKQFFSKRIYLNTHLQVVAVLIAFPIEFVLLNIYLPITDIISVEILTDLIDQMPQNIPVMICGDFNAHNTL